MKRYEEYKPSLTKWTPSIPQHWKQVRGKSVFYNQKQINTDNMCENILSLTLKGVIQNNKEKPIGLSPKDYCTYQIFEPNDLVFKLIDLENISTSRVGLVPERGIMSSAYIRLCQRGNENIRYMYYQYFDLYLRNIFNGLGAGVRSTLTVSDLLDLPIMIPSRAEQDQIVRYLDWQVSKINRLIAAKRKQIALLRERIQLTITDAVYYGIDQTVNYQPVKMLCIDKIPAHWEYKRGKFLFAEHDIRSMDGKEELLSVSHITGVTPRSQKNITMFKAESLVNYKICRKNDVAANTMWMWQGAIAVSSYHGVISPSYNTYHQIDNAYDSAYLDYMLRSKPLVDEYYVRSTGIRKSRLRLYPEQLLDMFFPVPPMEEQKLIAATITEKTRVANDFIAAIEKQIEQINELRVRMISDVVTGQVDVRGIEVPEYDAVAESDTYDEPEEDTEGEAYEE